MTTTKQTLEDGYYHLQRAQAALHKVLARNAYLEQENIRLHLAIRDLNDAKKVLAERYVKPTDAAEADARAIAEACERA